MEERVDPVHELLAEVASVQREQLRRADVLSDVRGRVAAQAIRPARKVRLWLAVPALAACGAAAVALTLGRAPALTFSAGAAGAAAPGVPGSELAARDDGELPLDFSDGSHVELAPGARLTVEAVEARGATLALARGRAEVHVVHREQTSWIVKAGPARVAVTGTRFWVGWDPAAGELSVEMREGSVVVSGAPGSTGNEVLRAGQTLRASRQRGRFEILSTLSTLPTLDTTATVPPAEAPAAAPTPARASGGPSPEARAARVTSRSSEPLLAPAPTPPSWRALASGTRYADALRAAERAGFDRSCETLGAEDLVLLGDVARLAGDPDRAEQAYRAARRRFPAVDRAAFALGLTAFEQRHRYAEAADWFDTYLRQYPGGSLAREASGRLLEAWHRAGEHENARRAAQAYLARYPSGPHATLARQILAP